MRGRLREGPFSLKGQMKALGLPYSKPEETLRQREKQIAALLRPLGRTGLAFEAKPQESGHTKRKRREAQRQGQG